MHYCMNAMNQCRDFSVAHVDMMKSSQFHLVRNLLPTEVVKREPFIILYKSPGHSQLFNISQESRRAWVLKSQCVCGRTRCDFTFKNDSSPLPQASLSLCSAVCYKDWPSVLHKDSQNVYCASCVGGTLPCPVYRHHQSCGFTSRPSRFSHVTLKSYTYM